MTEGKPKKVNESAYSMDMSLAEMLTAMIESTIAADQKAAEDYLRVLRTYALEPADGPDGHEKLKMVDFEMTDADGQRQIVSIPKLSLLPLPVLRVAEATFDMEAQIEINTSVSEKEQKGLPKAFSAAQAATANEDPVDARGCGNRRRRDRADHCSRRSPRANAEARRNAQ